MAFASRSPEPRASRMLLVLLTSQRHSALPLRPRGERAASPELVVRSPGYRICMSSLFAAYSSRRHWALVLDVVLVMVFAVIGRASHDEGLTIGGIAGTAWPFVVACLAGWLLVTVARWPHGLVWPAGIAIWVVTVAGGMGLRVLTGDTAAPAFIIVAALTLAVFLLVPRLALGRRSASSDTSTHARVETGKQATAEATSLSA